MAGGEVYSSHGADCPPNITIGVEVRRAAHDLIKTTVDRVCGNELEQQSRLS